jgi:hypothetical protein
MANSTQKRVDVNANVTKKSDNIVCVIINDDDQRMVNCLIFACTNPNAMDYIFFLIFLFFQYIYKPQWNLKDHTNFYIWVQNWIMGF